MDDSSSRLIQQLFEARQRYCFPPTLRTGVLEFTDKVLALLFPHFAEQLDCSEASIRRELGELEESLRQLQAPLASRYPGLAADLPERFVQQLPAIFELLREDAEAIYETDPAAQSIDEVILTYPGFYAIAIFRVAHALYELKFPLLPRMLTELAHQRTGVDIHPGATIGRRFVIDHGTGVVIGETTLIGDRVKLYQGVTLGALMVQKNLANKKRHPTLEDDVVVYANATILGGETIVGRGSIIAGNAWLTQSVPPSSVVTRRSEVRPRHADAEPGELDYHI